EKYAESATQAAPAISRAGSLPATVRTIRAVSPCASGAATPGFALVATLGSPEVGPTGAQPAANRQAITVKFRIALTLRQPCVPSFTLMTHLILTAFLALSTVPASAGEPLPFQVERPPARSTATAWFRDEGPARHGVTVARGRAADFTGFVTAAGLTSSVGDGCGPVVLRPRVRSISGT